MNQELLCQALKATEAEQKYAWATVVDSTPKGTPQKAGAKMLVTQNGEIFGTIGGGRYEKAAQKECLKAIKTAKTKLVVYEYFGQKGQSVCGGEIKVFIEPVLAQKEFVLCGGGHIGLPLSIIMHMQGFQITLIDNRRAFASKKRFPHAKRILYGSYVSGLNKLKLDQNSYIMIVTQGNEYDYKCLKKVIRSQAGYIGVISSRPKKIKFLNRLKKQGIEAKYLNRIHIPAGLDLGARSPAEIATSIAGEITQKINKDYIGSVKFK